MRPKKAYLNLAALFCAAALFAWLAAACSGEVHTAPPVTVTAAPSTPEITPSPAVPEITPSPTPARVVFTPSENAPLPGEAGVLPLGGRFFFGGSVTSDAPISEVCCTLDGTEYRVFPPRDTYELELLDVAFSGASLAELARFEELEAGEHTFELSAVTERGSARLASTAFTVTDSREIQLLPNNLRNSYTDALAFFGDEEKFMFTYSWGRGRRITVSEEWLDKYAVFMDGFDGVRWKTHIDAVPYYEAALGYIESTRIRVSGADFDSGVLPLSALLVSQSGPMVTRYVADMSFLSHHSFGTAIDINYDMVPNNNAIENRALITSEAALLSYNGIKEADGVRYYDFTYSGSYSERTANVPNTLLNYLLYELAFYRAGFAWGYYYPHCCDAMHFTLTELSPSLHDPALRLVSEYIA